MIDGDPDRICGFNKIDLVFKGRGANEAVPDVKAQVPNNKAYENTQ